MSKETQPPQRYGQGRLIKKMEGLGLDTKSTYKTQDYKQTLLSCLCTWKLIL